MEGYFRISSTQLKKVYWSSSKLLKNKIDLKGLCLWMVAYKGISKLTGYCTRRANIFRFTMYSVSYLFWLMQYIFVLREIRKRSTQWTFLPNHKEIQWAVLEWKIFKEYLKKIICQGNQSSVWHWIIEDYLTATGAIVR